MKTLSKQFEFPQTLMNRFPSWFTARSNHGINSWAIQLLQIEENDNVLEVGFGTGHAIQELAALAPGGFVAGVDPSEAAVKKAGQLNREAIAAGRVELKLGSVFDLPYPDNRFDKAFSVNSVQFWSDQAQAFEELRRVVRENGIIAATLHPRWVRSERELREVTEGLVRRFKEAGLARVMLYRKPAKPVPVFCVMGHNRRAD